MMDHLEEIQTLLDKYWLGETNLEEERFLKGYFAGPVHERFREFAPLFQTLRQEQAVRLERTNIVPMTTRRPVRMRWAAAASVAILVALGAWWMNRPVRLTEVVSLPPIGAPIPVPAPPAPTITPETPPVQMVVSTPAPPRKPAVKVKKAASPQLDPETEQAMEEIKAALSLVSSKLNKGKKAMLKDLNQLETIDKFMKPKGDS